MKKKNLTTLLVGALTALTASAQSTFSGSTLYGYCTSVYTATTLNGDYTMGAAMQLDSSTIKKFTGCKITAIAVANGTATDPAATPSAELTLFVGEELNTNPSQTFVGSMDFTQPSEYKEYALTEPITIDSDTPELFFGYTVQCNPGVYSPLVTDGTYDEDAGPGDYIGQLKDGEWIWQQLRSLVGMPCIRLKIEGDDLPANSVSLIEHHLPTYATPGGKATAGIYLRNIACNSVESVTVGYSLNGGETQSLTLQLPSPLLYNEHTDAITIDLPVPDVEGNDLPVVVEITGINADNAANNATSTARAASTTYLSLAKGFDKAMVVEEATATWCGFCPRGLVGMAAMFDAHRTDGRFIPIAAHYNDRLAIQSYTRFFDSDYTDATTPNCMINRNMEWFGTQDPAYSFLEAAYDEVTQQPALCSVEIAGLSFDASKKTMTIDAEVEFAIPVEGEYGFSFVLTEDNVGPYSQTNYFSPDYGYGYTLEWWDEQPSPVPNIYYDHIARNIYSFLGLKSSIPAEVEAGTKYSYTASLQTNTVTDINNCNVIVMVVNRTSGRIENATILNYLQASIDEVAAPAAGADNNYYDLQGRRVASPRAGQIYIHRGQKVLM